MPKVCAQMSISLDGHYTGPRTDDPSIPFFESPEALGFFRISRWIVDAFAWRERQHVVGGETDVHSEVVQEWFDRAGAYVMGRRMFDAGEVPWGDEPPFRAPVFVVTHREREPLERQGGTTFHFVTDGLDAAIAQAKAAAGDKDVVLAGGGELVRQALEAGHVEELELHYVPVVLGEGQRLLDLDLGATEGLELVETRTIAAPEVIHARYRVEGRKTLVLDDRGGALTKD